MVQSILNDLELIEMDMEKIETEFEFYNFRLESLKKECKCTSLCFIHYQQSCVYFFTEIFEFIYAR